MTPTKSTKCTHLILNGDLGRIALHAKHLVVVVALVEREEPNVGADEENGDAIDKQQPVEQDERCLAPYGDENQGADKGRQKHDPQDRSACRKISG